MENQRIKFISPSSFYYWEKCPYKAVLALQYKSIQIFPKHPDADLGTIIHKFYENRIRWRINTELDFEVRWDEMVMNLDDSYRNSPLQKNYYPIVIFGQTDHPVPI